MNVSSVKGASFALIVTCDPDKYLALYQFYYDLGFRVTKNYLKVSLLTNAALGGTYGPLMTLGVANDSLKELWMELFPLQDRDAKGHITPWQELSIYDGDVSEPLCQTTVIKLRLLSLDRATCDPESAASIGLYFFTTALDRVEQTLNTKRIDANHVVVSDPVGTELVFSNIPNMLSRDHYDSPQAYLDARKQQILGLRGRRGLTVGLAPVRPLSERGTARKKIAVMTSGGDAPGMNPAVRAVVRLGIYFGCDVYAVYEGYEGLVKGGDMIKRLSWSDVRGLLGLGGTVIGTARCAEFRERKGRLQAAYNLVDAGIDALIVIGGDGSLTGADKFREEWGLLLDELVKTKRIPEAELRAHRHLTIAGLVGLIDNDMAMTDLTIGALLALERICEMVDYIDATAASHLRAFVVEVMGRHCGWLGLMLGLLTAADYIFIPERPPPAHSWRQDLQQVCQRHRDKGRRKTTVIVAEGAIDDDLNPITSEMVMEALVELGLDTRITKLGHVQRGGAADANDRLGATLQGVEAVRAVLELTPDTPSPMIAMKDNRIERKPLMKAVAQTKKVAECIEAKDFDGAMALRDLAFADAWTAFKGISIYDDGLRMLPEAERLNIGVVHVGAALAGLNAATRAAALYCLAKGHRLFAIQGGFSGLVDEGVVRELGWLDVEGWHNQGGLEIGTNRSLPLCNYGKVAYYFQKFSLQGLLIVGGFEAFTALHQLHLNREAYPVFGIPLVVVPATVSNNVPGTEYLLGSNTCLDELVKYCDAVNQLAAAMRRRVFVVEVQGGHLGYVALYCGLVTGALAIYTPEERVCLRTLEEDIELLTELFADDRGEDHNGKMIIRNEQALTVYTTQLVADIIKESAKGRFDTRTAIPGHVQQGYVPLPLDRVMAVRLSIKGLQFIERLAAAFSVSSAEESTGNAVVMGILQGQDTLTPVDELYDTEADVALRKGKTVHWRVLTEVSDILLGRLLLRQRKEAQLVG